MYLTSKTDIPCRKKCNSNGSPFFTFVQKWGKCHCKRADGKSLETGYNGVIKGKTAPGWRIDQLDLQLTSGSSCLSKLTRGEICRKDEGKRFCFPMCKCHPRTLLSLKSNPTELILRRSCLPNAVVMFPDLSCYPASQEERPVAPRNLLPAHTDLLLV